MNETAATADSSCKTADDKAEVEKEKQKKMEAQDLADSCEAAISKLTVAPVILTHCEDSCSTDSEDDETEKCR